MSGSDGSEGNNQLSLWQSEKDENADLAIWGRESLLDKYRSMFSLGLTDSTDVHKTSKSMDGLKRQYYDKDFRIEYLSSRGDVFQVLFNKLMGLAYKGDFIASRPWGNRGDRKNDGHLPSERTLFQVYAPDEMKEKRAIAKINEDFEGAVSYWQEHFSKWVFVHNAKKGLPPHVLKCILDLRKKYPHIEMETWGEEELLERFRLVEETDLVAWFGVMPDLGDYASLGFDGIQGVLQRIAAQSAAGEREVCEVPMGKIEANALSESVAGLLKAGMVKAPLVRQYFEKCHDVTLGERVAEAFRQEYRRLSQKYHADEIFAELEAWTGGTGQMKPDRRVAVLAVLAYFFDSCDIFEKPRSIES